LWGVDVAAELHMWLRHFGGTCCLNLQGEWKMEAAGSSYAPVITHKTVRCNNPYKNDVKKLHLIMNFQFQ
jgi:hypothetical protein